MSRLIEKPYERMKEMQSRFLMSRSYESDLENLLKDELRSTFAAAEHAKDAGMLDRFADNALDYAITALISLARVDGRCWHERTTLFGAERKLSAFGEYLIRVIEFYKSVDEAELKGIVSRAIARVGLK